MGMVCEPLIIIHPSAHLQFMVMVGMAPFLVPAVEGFPGVEAVAGVLAVGEASVVGSGNAWGNCDGKRGAISTTG